MADDLIVEAVRDYIQSHKDLDEKILEDVIARTKGIFGRDLRSEINGLTYIREESDGSESSLKQVKGGKKIGSPKGNTKEKDPVRGVRKPSKNKINCEETPTKPKKNKKRLNSSRVLNMSLDTVSEKGKPIKKQKGKQQSNDDHIDAYDILCNN